LVIWRANQRGEGKKKKDRQKENDDTFKSGPGKKKKRKEVFKSIADGKFKIFEKKGD